jgi:hypothetical protein
MSLLLLFTGSTGGSQTITGSLFTNSNTFFAATVGRGAVNISGALYTNTNTLFGATVGRGAVNIAGALYTNTQTFYGSTLTTSATITGALFTNSQTFYQATIDAPAPQTITGALFVNANTFYAATVGAAARPAQGGAWLSEEQVRAYEKHRARKQRAIDELEETIERAYADLHGKVPQDELPSLEAESPAVVVKQARIIAKAIVGMKARGEAGTTELALLKKIKRLADQVMADINRQGEEEEAAIVMLLLA